MFDAFAVLVEFGLAVSQFPRVFDAVRQIMIIFGLYGLLMRQVVARPLEAVTLRLVLLALVARYLLDRRLLAQRRVAD